MEKLYKIYPISEFDNIDWDLFLTEKETCRKSLDGSEFVVKLKIPTIEEGYLTHEEALEITRSTKWRNLDPFPQATGENL